MKSTTFALVASFATTILASPLHMAQHAERQDVTYVTKTDVKVDQVQVTRYVTAGAQETDVVTVTSSSDAPASSEEAHHRNGGNHHWSWSQQSESSTSAPAPPPVVVSSSSPPPPPASPTPSPSSTPEPSPSPSPEPTTSSTTQAPPPATSSQAPAANNPGTATAGMTYKAAASPYPQPSTWTNQAPEAYNAFDGTLQQASLNATNKWRKMFNAQPVVWNYTIEQQIVDVNNNKTHHQCSFMHTNVDCGQNIASGYGSPMEAIDGWGNEYTQVNFNAVDWNENTGHFTQLVWQETTSIGCAAVNCNGIPAPPGDGHADGWFYVCNYWPTGNMLGDFPKNVKAKVSS